MENGRNRLLKKYSRALTDEEVTEAHVVFAETRVKLTEKEVESKKLLFGPPLSAIAIADAKLELGFMQEIESLPVGERAAALSQKMSVQLDDDECRAAELGVKEKEEKRQEELHRAQDQLKKLPRR